jgi:hypothetical protein
MREGKNLPIDLVDRTIPGGDSKMVYSYLPLRSNLSEKYQAQTQLRSSKTIFTPDHLIKSLQLYTSYNSSIQKGGFLWRVTQDYRWDDFRQAKRGQ